MPVAIDCGADVLMAEPRLDDGQGNDGRDQPCDMCVSKIVDARLGVQAGAFDCGLPLVIDGAVSELAAAGCEEQSLA